MLNNPYKTYQNTQVQTASQGQLILMLFDGAIKFCKAAIQALDEKDYERVNNNIIRAQAIINELMITLNLDTEEEVVKNIYKLYEYMYYRLIMANVKKDHQMIEEVIKMCQDFRETWEEVIKITRQKSSTVTDNVQS